MNRTKRLMTADELWERGACWIVDYPRYLCIEVFSIDNNILELEDGIYEVKELNDKSMMWCTDSDRTTYHSFWIEDDT